MSNRNFFISTFLGFLFVFLYFLTYGYYYINMNFDQKEIDVDFFHKYEVTGNFIRVPLYSKRVNLRIDIVKSVEIVSEKVINIKTLDDDTFKFNFEEVKHSVEFIEDLKEWNNYSKTKIEFK